MRSVLILMLLFMLTPSCKRTTYCKGVDRSKFFFMIQGEGHRLRFADSLGNERSFRVSRNVGSAPFECQNEFRLSGKSEECFCSWWFEWEARDSLDMKLGIRITGSDDDNNIYDDYSARLTYTVDDFTLSPSLMAPWKQVDGEGNYERITHDVVVINGYRINQVVELRAAKAQLHIPAIYVNKTFGIIAFTDSTTKTTFLLHPVI